ncbi:hypothetical protein DFP72DRAFT_1074671 [Ephemerocybe angulata]|uniref:Uncharacterized protein n=1 Tax=Ephemerocybe angulata TaxID=980116 RepID=A0A8H6HKS4_9AGAR|nr:hypothetical protein DFP72DRAFT_1074671 [Tulosesus angulatus]
MPPKTRKRLAAAALSDDDDEWIKQVPRRSNAAATRIKGQPVPKAHWGADTGSQSEPAVCPVFGVTMSSIPSSALGPLHPEIKKDAAYDLWIRLIRYLRVDREERPFVFDHYSTLYRRMETLDSEAGIPAAEFLDYFWVCPECDFVLTLMWKDEHRCAPKEDPKDAKEPWYIES